MGKDERSESGIPAQGEASPGDTLGQEGKFLLFGVDLDNMKMAIEEESAQGAFLEGLRLGLGLLKALVADYERMIDQLQRRVKE